MDPSNPISRRTFLARSGKTAASLAAASTFVSQAMSRPASAKVMGANERVNVAVVGIRSRGKNHYRSFAGMKDVNLSVLCDIDENLYADSLKELQKKFNIAPATEWDYRKVLDNKEIDAVSLATPNHWHALGTIWGCQAGKHVYVENPACYSIWEGRKMVEAARKYKRIVQVGFQNRSKPTVREGIQLLHEGVIGEVYMARGLCFKPRGNIAAVPDSAVPAGVHYDEWIGPAAERPFNVNRFHYNWHWQWEYGNGDIGNQGPHQFDIARWGLQKEDSPVKIRSMGGCFAWKNGIQETANTQTAIYEYADGKILQFEVRGWYTNEEAGDWYGDTPVGNLFYGSEGWMAIKGDDYFVYLGRENKPGPTSKKDDGKPQEKTGGVMNLQGAPNEQIFRNFIDAVKANDAKLLTSDVESGHISTILPHLANISYRLKRDLTFDGKNEKFVNDRDADAMLRRAVYREPYVISDQV